MSNPAYDTVKVPNVTLKASRDKAGLYELDDGVNHWLPWSQIRDNSVDKDGESGDLFIPRWLAEKNDIEYEEES